MRIVSTVRANAPEEPSIGESMQMAIHVERRYREIVARGPADDDERELVAFFGPWLGRITAAACRLNGDHWNGRCRCTRAVIG